MTSIYFAEMMGGTLPQCAPVSADCADETCNPSNTSAGSQKLLAPVGRGLPRAFDEDLDLSSLTDAELTARIDLCALQMLAAHALGMKDERRRWYDEEAKALRERSRRPAMVAAMEAEIEARMAQSDGAAK